MDAIVGIVEFYMMIILIRWNNFRKDTLMKNTKQILQALILSLIILVSIFGLSACNSTNSIDEKINNLLKDDLNSSVKITKLYYNEEKQGCFVEFQTSSYTDKAAIKLKTGEIEYESEFDYWSTKVGEHEYNQKILNSFYAEWNFSITVFEANGRPEDSSWKKIK